MEADLKTQAAFAVGMLGAVALSSTAFEYMDEALRTVRQADFIMTSQPQGQQPDTADERLASFHSIASACHEVAELELSVEAATIMISRCVEPNQAGLQVAAWRGRTNELVQAVVRARERLELAAVSCHESSAIQDVAKIGWSNFPWSLGQAWMKDSRRALLSSRDYLNEARDSLTKTCAAAARARDAAKLPLELL